MAYFSKSLVIELGTLAIFKAQVLINSCVWRGLLVDFHLVVLTQLCDIGPVVLKLGTLEFLGQHCLLGFKRSELLAQATGVVRPIDFIFIIRITASALGFRVSLTQKLILGDSSHFGV